MGKEIRDGKKERKERDVRKHPLEVNFWLRSSEGGKRTE